MGTGVCRQVSLLSPPDWGLPEKFDQWRPTQEEAITNALDSNKRFVAQCAPTGSGKSLIYVANAVLSNTRVCIITATKGLQAQLMRDFGSIGLCSIEGKSNYQCGFKPGFTCEEGQIFGCPAKQSIQCPRQQAYIKARVSRFVVTNYSYWIAEWRYGLGLGNFGLVVFDEAHHSPLQLSAAMQLKLSYREIEDLLGLRFPLSKELADWRDWAKREAAPRAEMEVASIKSRIEGGSRVSAELDDLRKVQNVLRKLKVVATIVPADWVMEHTDHGYDLDPIDPSRYAESTLFVGLPKIQLVSATIRPKTLGLLGVKNGDADYFEYPSSFPQDRCPVYYVPTVRVDYRLDPQGYAVWQSRADQIISRRLDRRGIFHTVSYQRRDSVLRNSQHRHFCVTNYQGDITAEIVEQFKRQPPPAVLVSPSISTGYDFPYTAAEFNIIGKVPFPETRSAVMKARKERDPEYPFYLAAQDLEQARGRIMRAPDDRGETVIIDDHITWFARQYGHLFTKNFRVKQLDALPPPPPKLEK